MKTTKWRLPPSLLCAVIAPGMMNPSFAEDIAPRRGLDNVSFDRVELRGGFWEPRLDIHHKTTIPHALDAPERNGHVTNFDKAAGKTNALDAAKRFADHIDSVSGPGKRYDVGAHEKLLEDKGKVALMRGPVVYCLEGVDNKDIDLFKMTSPRDAGLNAEHRPELLNGVTVIQGKGLDVNQRSFNLTAVPYYAWANRQMGPMTIWINISRS